ncbi:MAG: cupin domain-containing protein [Desulfobacteraceae bacterium]|nr:cupin domain-containing protein [Desulfobacteraceae bacterium]
MKNEALNEVGKIYRRPWGTYKTIEMASNYQVKIITVNPKSELSLQKHFKRSEHWVVATGQLQATINDEVKTLKANDSVDIPVQAKHRMGNVTDEPGVFIELQLGSYLGEDDIVRFEDIYGRE